MIPMGREAFVRTLPAMNQDMIMIIDHAMINAMINAVIMIMIMGKARARARHHRPFPLGFPSAGTRQMGGGGGRTATDGKTLVWCIPTPPAGGGGSVVPGPPETPQEGRFGSDPTRRSERRRSAVPGPPETPQTARFGSEAPPSSRGRESASRLPALIRRSRSAAIHRSGSAAARRRAPECSVNANRCVFRSGVRRTATDGAAFHLPERGR